jgi:hypothetical protein
MNKATFSGQSQAKGRNGYFALAEASTVLLSDGDGAHVVHVELQSKRTGNAAPVVLSLTDADLTELVCLLSRASVSFDADVKASKAHHEEMRAYRQSQVSA